MNTELWQRTAFAAQNVEWQISRLKFGDNGGTPQTCVSLVVFLTTPRLNDFLSLIEI